MSVGTAKVFVVTLVDDREATERADDAYLNALATIAAEKGYEVSTDDLREALRQLAGLGEFEDDTLSEVSGFMMNSGRGATLGIHGLDSFSSFSAAFSPLGFLRF